MALSKPELKYIENLFHKMDKDQNGRVALTEFLEGALDLLNPFYFLFALMQLVVDKVTPERRSGRCL